MKMHELVDQYLKETKVFSEKEIQNLSEEAKGVAIKDAIKTILDQVEDRSRNLDLTPVNRTKGDIRQLKELTSIQEAITNLEEIIQRAEKQVTPELKYYLSEVVQSLYNLRDYSYDFKEAYKNRKILMILKYQSLVLSVFSAVSYLISVLIDFSNDDVDLQGDPRYEEIAPIRTLIDFNRSIEKGEYRKMVKSVNETHELYPFSDDRVLNESSDVINMVLDGIKSFSSSVNTNGKFIDYLYKAAGIVTLIMSLREVFYALYRAKSKVSDMASQIEGFASISSANQSILSRLSNFASKFKIEAEESSKLARREIEIEDREIGMAARSMASTIRKEPQTVAQDFSDFNF
jgi:hypothetical protein